jgi:hypothetical protein
MKTTAKDYTGLRFGKLLVLEPGPRTKGKLTWKCQCDCGKIVNRYTGTFSKNGTRSCGCLVFDKLHLMIARNNKKRTERIFCYDGMEKLL